LKSVLGEGKADAALIASMVHYGDYSLPTIKQYLSDHGIPVRTRFK
jgi:cyclase